VDPGGYLVGKGQVYGAKILPCCSDALSLIGLIRSLLMDSRFLPQLMK
jgi:hypothetical protein